MDKILAQLLSSEFLNEETKATIKQQWETSVEAFKAEIREETEVATRQQLVKEFTKAREDLAEKLNTLVESILDAELIELKEDIAQFRDLEIESAAKLAEEKKALAEQFAQDMDTLTEKLDEFLELRITAEVSELHEEIQAARENQFGRKIVEAFRQEYTAHFHDEEGALAKLAIAEDRAAELEAQLEEAAVAAKDAERARVMESVLTSLTGAKREQMRILLSNVKTEKLAEGYAKYIGRILSEETIPATKLNESAKPSTLFTGNEKEPTVTPVAPQLDEEYVRAMRIAGVQI